MDRLRPVTTPESPTGPMPLPASVVVVAYHRPDSLARLLCATVAPDMEVVVVNIDADPDVREAAAAHPGVTVVDQDNLGYAAAVNRGATKATADVVVFTNDDVVIDAATVRRLADRVRNGDADVVVPAVRDCHGRVAPTITALPTPRNLLREWALAPDAPVRGWPRRLRPQKWRTPGVPESIDAASAVTVAVDAELLAEVPLPEQYFLYWEESDWFLRLARRAARVVYDPTVWVIHDGGRDDVRTDKARLMATNAVRCVRDTQGHAAARRAAWIVVLWQGRLLVADTARWWFRRPPGGRTRMQARRAGLVAAIRARDLLR